MGVADRSKISLFLVRLCYLTGSLALVTMMMVVVANILGRALFNLPIFGTMEIAGFAGVIVGAVAVSFAERSRSNIAACAVLDTLPGRVKKIVNIFNYFLSTCAVALFFWASARAAVVAMSRGETTFALELQVAPFRLIWAAGILLLCWFLLLHFIEILGWRNKK
jgi:TRAP-type C4-dicarboxylate transport system permease small subunit